SIVRSVDMQLARIVEADYLTVPADDAVIGDISTEHQLLQVITQLEAQMREAAKNFEFERAAGLRDRIRALKQRDLGAIFSATVSPGVSLESQPVGAADESAHATQPMPGSNQHSNPAANLPATSGDATASAAVASKSPRPAARRRAR